MSNQVLSSKRSAVDSWTGAAGIGGMIAATLLAAATSLWKVLLIGWVGFAAMMGGAVLGARAARRPAEAVHPRRLAWAYGLSSGAMIMSACLFLVPTATAHDARLGGIGIALGLTAGFALHLFGHGGRSRSNRGQGTRSGSRDQGRGEHPDASVPPVVGALLLHAVAAGLVIGGVYAAMPSMGATLGLSIVSHKAPAGYVAARRLTRQGKSIVLLVLPAAAVGIAAVPVGLVDPPSAESAHGLAFGLATGAFLHVAIDFLPQCDWGSELYRAAQSDGKERADAPSTTGCPREMRRDAVVSTVAGGLLVVGAWIVL
jgi:ZIP family zinc transporter